MEFVAVDFETADYAPESACSIGLIKYRNWNLVDSYSSLIRPPRLFVRRDFTAIHGITAEHLAGAPAFADIWGSEILPFIDGSPLAAHNAAFDMRVLSASLEHSRISAPALKYCCSLIIARKLWPNLPSRSLAALSDKFGIVFKAHDALEDARACAAVLKIAARETNSATLRELLRRTRLEMKRLIPLHF